MFQTFLIIGVVVLLLLAALAVYISKRPDSFHVERSARIAAPADVVFSIINNLQKWSLWSPYDKRDPNMKKTLEGPAAGPGASYAWDGNSKVGAGRLTIVESKPGELVAMKLGFLRPFACTNPVRFQLAPTEGGTQVSWIMDGKHDFMSKAMSLFIDMDKMCGKDFEQGLANLNTLAQAELGQTAPA